MGNQGKHGYRVAPAITRDKKKLTMKKLQQLYLFSYRLVGFIFLMGLIVSILWYGFTLLFFVGSSSWSVPLILSPHQEKVIAHLEHVLALEQQVTNTNSEILVFEQTIAHKKHLLKINQQLLSRINESIKTQSKDYRNQSQRLSRLSQEKNATVKELRQLALMSTTKEAVIAEELKLGLITKQEAFSTRISTNQLHASLVDAKAGMYELKHRSLDYAHAAQTLNGSANDLKSMDKVIKRAELENQISQLKIDILSLYLSIDHLKNNNRKKSKALTLIKQSPYILATRKPTTVASVPYSNLKHLKLGSPIYSCYLDMLLCYKSGQIVAIYPAEEYFNHPVFKSEIKGQLIGISFYKESDAHKKLLFLNSKPLFI